MRFIVVLLIAIPVLSFSQSDSSPRRIRAIGIIYVPEFSYRTLNYAPSQRWVESLRNENEIGNFGFTSGVKLRLRSKRKWRLETGLLYANRSFKTKSEELMWASDDPTLPQTSKTIFRLKYLSLPVNVNYPVASHDRLTLSAKAGLSANVFLSAKTKVVIGYGNGDETSHSSVKQVGHTTFSLSGLIGATVDYELSDRFILTAEPYYQRFLTSINADNNAGEYPFAFGMGLGASYLF